MIEINENDEWVQILLAREDFLQLKSNLLPEVYEKILIMWKEKRAKDSSETL
jgi:hypothetical protein